MEQQQPTTNQIAASIFFKDCQNVPFQNGFIQIEYKPVKNGSAPITFSFTDKETQTHYLKYLERIVGDRDYVLFQDSKRSAVKIAQIDDFLRRLLTNTLYTRRTEFINDKIFNSLKKYPYRSQDGLSLKAKVIARYFNESGSGTWYVTELADIQKKDQDLQPYLKEDKKLKLSDLEDLNFFGAAELGYDFEWGAFSMNELKGLLFQHQMEIVRDTHIEPLKYTLEECFKLYNERLM